MEWNSQEKIVSIKTLKVAKSIKIDGNKKYI